MFNESELRLKTKEELIDITQEALGKAKRAEKMLNHWDQKKRKGKIGDLYDTDIIDYYEKGLTFYKILSCLNSEKKHGDSKLSIQWLLGRAEELGIYIPPRKRK